MWWIPKSPAVQPVLYPSADSIEDNEGHGEEGILMYPVEYLNSINCSGLPLAKPALKVGCPIMCCKISIQERGFAMDHMVF